MIWFGSMMCVLAGISLVSIFTCARENAYHAEICFCLYLICAAICFK